MRNTPPIAPAAITRANAAQAFQAAKSAAPGTTQAKARKAAQDFEGVLVNNLVGAMVSGLQGEGPLGVNGVGGDAWRGLLVQELSNSMTKAGGVGVAAQVYRDILRGQARRAGGGEA